ncbi:hypothetical protein DAI22_01g275100 [Oryza sativa Japonica Group]|nr:hypothetical protein DAI22_01g275100 [Oryza sativa Japonica Group]
MRCLYGGGKLKEMEIEPVGLYRERAWSWRTLLMPRHKLRMRKWASKQSARECRIEHGADGINNTAASIAGGRGIAVFALLF